MGNCLPLLFPGLFRGDEQSPLEEFSSNPSANVQAGYVNDLFTQEEFINEQNQLKKCQDVQKTRISVLIEQIPADEYKGGSKGDIECAICMVEFCDGDAIRYLPCMHSYHMACIDDWLIRSFTCPSCMEPVDSAILSSFTAHRITLDSLECAPATSGHFQTRTS